MIQAETRKLAAIMFTDIVGFSRQMGSNEVRMLRLLDIHNQIIQQAVADHHGAVIKTVGDAFLVDFPSVVNAVQCAQTIQAQLRVQNADKESAEQIYVRIGIHLGDIVQKDGDVFGDGVNIASRLQGLAEPDSICISDVVYRDVAKKVDLGAVASLGRPKLKNIAERFEVYLLLSAPPHGLQQTLHVQRLKLSRRLGAASLARAVLVVVGLLIGGGIITLLYPSIIRIPQSAFRNQEALPLPDKPSLVVLPFANMSGDLGQEYFSDGITEELTTSLSRLSDLFVISRNSAFFYKGKAVKMQDLSKELGVRYVLEGSLRKAGDQVRITAQLIDATTDYHLWSERYDRPLKDIFALQDEIVQKIVATLKLQLALWERGVLVRKRTDNLEAYDFYLRGLEHSQRRLTKETNAQARQMYEKALELDPQYAEAYQALSFTYLREWISQWSPAPQNLERAFELAQRVTALDDSQPGGHNFLSLVFLLKRQHDRAIAEAERAITLDPNNDVAYTNLALALGYAGRPEEAIELVEKAMRLNPRSVWNFYVLGWTYNLAGRCEEAIAVEKRVLTRAPNFTPACWVLAVCSVELGRMEEARAAAAEFMRLEPSRTLEEIRATSPFKDSAMLERQLAALRKAGLK